MLATLAVFAILASVAAPSLGTFLKDNRISSAAADIAGTLNNARGEAIKRGGTVVMCRTGDPEDQGDAGYDPDCKTIEYPGGGANQSRDWSYGSVMYFTTVASPTNYDKTVDVLIQSDSFARKGVTVTSNAFSDEFVAFEANGNLRVGSATDVVLLAVCDDRGAGKGRLVRIRASGRTSVGVATTCTP